MIQTPLYVVCGSLGMVVNPMTTEYQAVISRATALGYALPSPQQQILDNNKIFYLKHIGAWNEIDVLYCFKRGSLESDFSKINFKNPASNLITSSSMPVFIDGIGWQAGAGSYLDTNYIPSTASNKMKINNASVFFKGSMLTPSSPMSVYGTRNGSNNNFWKTGNDSYLSAATQTANSVSSGYLGDIFDTKTGTTQSGYRDGVLIQQKTITSVAFSTVNLLLFCLNNNGTRQNFTTQAYRVEYFGTGSGLLEPMQSDILKIMNDTYRI